MHMWPLGRSVQLKTQHHWKELSQSDQVGKGARRICALGSGIGTLVLFD